MSTYKVAVVRLHDDRYAACWTGHDDRYAACWAGHDHATPGSGTHAYPSQHEAEQIMSDSWNTTPGHGELAPTCHGNHGHADATAHRCDRTNCPILYQPPTDA